MDESMKIRGEVLASSFYENWNFYKELCRMGSDKKFQQRIEVEKIRKEWIAHQKKAKLE